MTLPPSPGDTYLVEVCVDSTCDTFDVSGESGRVSPDGQVELEQLTSGETRYTSWREIAPGAHEVAVNVSDETGTSQPLTERLSSTRLIDATPGILKPRSTLLLLSDLVVFSALTQITPVLEWNRPRLGPLDIGTPRSVPSLRVLGWCTTRFSSGRGL